MDALILIIIALFFTLRVQEETIFTEDEPIQLEIRMNPTRYHDEKGFMVVADVLDFE